MPVSRRSAVVVHAFLSVLLLHSAPTQADELPTPADILAALQAHRDGITREWSVTVWENFWQGKQTATSIVTIHRMERELIRYQQDDYVYKRGTTEGLLWAFDGKLAWRIDTGHRARVRRPFYPTAEVMIWGKGSRNAEEPFSMRNPNFLVHASFLRRLTEQVDAGGPVTVSRKADSESLLEIRVPGEERDFVGTVDSARPGLLLTTRQFDRATGTLRRLVVADYEEYAPGKWRVQRGSAVWLPEDPKDPRPMEWRFECRQNLLNEDADFSDDVFQVQLLPGMHVYDIRHKVGYQVEPEQSGADPDGLAAVALLKKSTAPLNIRRRDEPETP